MIISGIGSRQTPQNVCDEMTKIGIWCRENNIYIRSGHAEGADWAFEQGSQENTVVYLPWVGFNKQLVSKATTKCVDTKEGRELASKFHPVFAKLSNSVKKLISRDGYQILGDNLNEPVNAVICFTPHGAIEGGSGQAMRIAKANNIPILNMFCEEFNTSGKVIEYLKKLQEK